MIKTTKPSIDVNYTTEETLDVSIKIMELAVDELYILLNKTSSLTTFKIINLMQDFINIQKNKVL